MDRTRQLMTTFAAFGLAAVGIGIALINRFDKNEQIVNLIDFTSTSRKEQLIPLASRASTALEV